MLLLACLLWLSTMELILRHLGFPTRLAIHLILGAVCALGVFVGLRRKTTVLRRWLVLPGAAVAAFGVYTYVSLSRAAHFEGFSVVLLLLFVLEGVLLLAEAGQA